MFNQINESFVLANTTIEYLKASCTYTENRRNLLFEQESGGTVPFGLWELAVSADEQYCGNEKQEEYDKAMKAEPEWVWLNSRIFCGWAGPKAQVRIWRDEVEGRRCEAQQAYNQLVSEVTKDVREKGAAALKALGERPCWVTERQAFDAFVTCRNALENAFLQEYDKAIESLGLGDIKAQIKLAAEVANAMK